MSFIMSSLQAVSATLNEPTVKQTVKKVIGDYSFVLGTLAALGLVFGTSDDSKEAAKRAISRSFTCVASRISLVLSGAVSPIGITVISTVGNVILSKQMFEKFGPNTIFAINPWHPRHVVSIAAVVFSIPAVIKVLSGKNDSYFNTLAVINTLISRPFLHIANQFIGKVIR